MKFQVGNLIRLNVVNSSNWYRQSPKLNPKFGNKNHPLNFTHIANSNVFASLDNKCGIIISCYRYDEVFDDIKATDNHNVYVWTSQEDMKTYFFYESDFDTNEVLC